MTEVEFIKNLLERDWSPSIGGRATDVPDPADDEITWTLEKEKRTGRLRNQDVGYITSGADANVTAADLGWTHQNVDTAVVIEYRLRTREVNGSYDNGYNRLFGARTGPDGVGAPDDWDGITGETMRVILANRRRTAEWTRIGTNNAGESMQVRDLTDLGGTNYWRADVYIPMDIFAQEINV